VVSPFFLLTRALALCYNYNESDQIYRILRNDALDIRQLKPLALAATLFADPTADGSSDPKLYRPLACLTFGFNWYAGQNNVFGYHLVNVGIHLLTAYFLFFTIDSFMTLQAGSGKNQSTKKRYGLLFRSAGQNRFCFRALFLV
jgi:hypothetical protein